MVILTPRKRKDRNSRVSRHTTSRDSIRKWTRCRLWLELLEDRTLLSTVTWIGGSGNWNTASNWSSNPALPGPDDDAVIDVAGITVTHNSGAHSIKSLTFSNNHGTR